MQHSILDGMKIHYPKSIYSYVENPHTKSRGYLTNKNMDNFTGSHAKFYQDFIRDLKK